MGNSSIEAFERVKVLGAGTEGIVYRARRGEIDCVLKVFREPIAEGSVADMEAYAERVRAARAGFAPIELIRRDGRIAAVCYESPPLFELSPYCYRISERLAQAFLSHFCHAQSYLIREHSLAMVDGGQFLLSRRGTFHYVDYGTTIMRSDNMWCRERGYTPYSFFVVLLRLFGIIVRGDTRQPGFRYDRPCDILAPGQIEKLLKNRPWTRPVVDAFQHAKAELFLRPDFYEMVAALFPRRVRRPGFFIHASRILNIPRKLQRRRFRQMPERV